MMNQPIQIDARISSASARMRVSRQRRREGLFCLNVEVRFSEVDRLIAIGLLPPEERYDRNAIVQAIYKFLDTSPIGCAHQHRYWHSNAAG